MLLPELDFVAPSTVADAIRTLSAAAGGAKLLAGGTDLLAQARNGRIRPAVFVDLKRIPGMIGISEKDGAFEIGAATPGAMIGEHAGLRKTWPGVVEAATLIGSTQIQSRASLGGNLCNSSPAADSVPALMAAGAVCILEGPHGRREIPVELIQVAPGKTSLASDEILIAFRLFKRPAKSGDAYLRLIPRSEMDIAVAGAGVSLTVDDNGVVTAARVAVGAVAPTSLLVQGAANALVGTTADEEALSKLEAAVRAVCRPISDKRGTAEYRIRIAGVLARRAATIAYERACA
jgi:carbon-monoxide dehydrogenase medium subunit